MADVITRFKLETTQYDSKLRDASKALAAYSKQAELAGKDFDKFTKEQAEVARSMGSITTSATNAKDKVKELVSAYNDVAKAYNALTKEQQESDFGKAMAASLQQLQGRIRDAKAEMTSTGGVLDQLKSKFTVNIDALKLFNMGLSAAKGALDVAKDAFFASENSVDEWGRVVASSQAVYQGFLTAINNGDVSGYLNNINSIVQAAREAYNELDRLGTMKTIQSPQMSAQQTENERMRMMIQTGRYIAPVDGRRAAMQNGQLLTANQIENIKRNLQGGLQKVTNMVGNEVKQTNRAINAYYNSLAKQNGMSTAEFKAGTSSMAAFDERIRGYQAYRDYQRQHTIQDDRTGISRYIGGVNPYERYKNWGTFRVDKMGENSYNDLVNLIKQRDQQAGQAYSMQSQAYRAMNRTEGITVSKIMGNTGGGGGGTTTVINLSELQQNQKTINDLTQEYVNISDDANTETIKRQEEIRKEIQLLEQRNNMLKLYQEQAQGKLLGGNVKTEALTSSNFKGFANYSIPEIGQGLGEEIMKAIKEGLTNSQNKKDKKDIRSEDSISKNLEKFTGYAGQTLGGVQDIVGGISQLGVEIPKDLQSVLGGIQGIISIVTGIASLVAIIEALTTVQTTESTIKSIPVIGWALAGGGIIHAANGYVPGNNYSGDQVPALLNSGELVLNKAQQNALANELQGNGIQNLNLHAQVEGEKILLVMNRHLKRTGKGEIVTWRE